MRGINCKALWIKALCSPFYHFTIHSGGPSFPEVSHLSVEAYST
uniref:Uncharacterized protein n=1 Tax=Anguilla anguilla TaxID=7936 RepID=A0A0E9T5B1_ANGAN